MSWTSKYWDAIDQLFWSPQYLGLKSIPQKRWEIDGDRVCVPRELTNPSGPLYFRLRSGDEYWDYIRKQEETFNHIFDLVFAILPGDVVSEIFGVYTGAGSGHPYESFGRELSERYFGSQHANITNPDGFFIAPASILAVELKFNAKTSLDQLAKYMLIFGMEERISGQRQYLDLIYVFPTDPDESLVKQVGARVEDIGDRVFEYLCGDTIKGRVARFFDEHRDGVLDVIQRAKIRAISWQELSGRIQEFSGSLDHSRGDRTLQNLLAGFVDEIQRHPLSGVVTKE